MKVLWKRPLGYLLAFLRRLRVAEPLVRRGPGGGGAGGLGVGVAELGRRGPDPLVHRATQATLFSILHESSHLVGKVLKFRQLPGLDDRRAEDFNHTIPPFQRTRDGLPGSLLPMLIRLLYSFHFPT